MAGVTSSVAVAVLPVPPSVEVICTELFLVPAVVPVTFVTVKKQEPLAASVAPDRLTTSVPEVAVIVPLVDPAVQFPLKPFGVETTRPAGRVSVNATPVRPTVEFGLVYVNVSVVPPLSGIDAAPNALTTVGARGAVTVTDALDVLPVPPSVEVICTELFFDPRAWCRSHSSP